MIFKKMMMLKKMLIPALMVLCTSIQTVASSDLPLNAAIALTNIPGEFVAQEVQTFGRPEAAKMFTDFLAKPSFLNNLGFDMCNGTFFGLGLLGGGLYTTLFSKNNVLKEYRVGPLAITAGATTIFLSERTSPMIKFVLGEAYNFAKKYVYRSLLFMAAGVVAVPLLFMIIYNRGSDSKRRWIFD